MRLATGRGVGLAVGEAVGARVRVGRAVGGGKLGRGVEVLRAWIAAVGKGAGVGGGITGRQALDARIKIAISAFKRKAADIFIIFGVSISFQGKTAFHWLIPIILDGSQTSIRPGWGNKYLIDFLETY